MTIAVLGAGAWGTALAIALARRGEAVLWGRDAGQMASMRATGDNARYLPGVTLPASLRLEDDLAGALKGAALALIVVPTNGFRAMLRALRAIDARVPILWACKGFEQGGAKLPHQVLAEELGGEFACGVLSGPSFAQEVAAGLPTALTLASADAQFARDTARRLHSARLRVYAGTDVVGVEVGGAVKNVMAIAAGICDGLQFGLNARAALITRGLAEMTRLGVALGGQPETFMGLTGVGDLILTCTGNLSRNRTVGLKLAEGKPLATILAELGHVAEGVNTAREVSRLASACGVDMPITHAVCRILYDGTPARAVVEDLLSREPKLESGFVSS